MATLHVRNVPEPIYELLRECAEREGRSIGAQAIAFIQQGVMPRASRRPWSRPRPGPFERFSAPARQVIVRAQDEARAAGAAAVEPAHVVLALLAEEGAADAVATLGVDPGAIRSALPRGAGSPPQIPFAPETKKVLEQALRESLALRHEWIGREHLLLALAADPVLAGAGGEDAVRAAAMHGFARGGAPWPPPTDDREYLAIDLAGTADEWTARLNDLAGEGWELLQVVGHRAVLRRA